MLRKEDAVIGNRVVWRSSNPRLPATFGTIVDVLEGQCVIEYDDGDEGITFINHATATVYPATTSYQ
jgi:hypothetical protein